MILAAGIPSLTSATGWSAFAVICIASLATFVGLMLWDCASEVEKKAAPHRPRNVALAIVVTGTVLVIITALLMYHAAWVDYVRNHPHTGFKA